MINNKHFFHISLIIFIGIGSNQATSDYEGRDLHFIVRGFDGEMVRDLILPHSRVQEIMHSGLAENARADYEVMISLEHSDEIEAGLNEETLEHLREKFMTEERATKEREIIPITSQITHTIDGITRLNPLLLRELLNKDPNEPMAYVGLVDKDGSEDVFKIQVIKNNIIDDEHSANLPVFGICCRHTRNRYSPDGWDLKVIYLSPLQLAHELLCFRPEYKVDVDAGKIYHKIIGFYRDGGTTNSIYFGHANSLLTYRTTFFRRTIARQLADSSPFFDINIIPQLANMYEWMNFVGLDRYKSDKIAGLERFSEYASTISIKELDGTEKSSVSPYFEKFKLAKKQKRNDMGAQPLAGQDYESSDSSDSDHLEGSV